jgi:exo-beta-1,3-glucanase (GH17 family)
LNLLPSVSQIREDFQQIKAITGNIRLYECNDNVYQAIIDSVDLGFKITIGVQLNLVNTDYQLQKTIDLANMGLVEAIIVGNETLLTNALSQPNLIDRIKQVKRAVPAEIKVSTAEPWNIWLNNSDLINAVDFVVIHVHPFWEDQKPERAAGYVLESYNKVKKATGDKEVVIGETGWPTGGTAADAAVSQTTVPSEQNQRNFLVQFTSLASENSIKYFWFSAFDEEWKWKENRSGLYLDLKLPLDRDMSGHYPGSSWGLLYSDGQIKKGLIDLLPGNFTFSTRTARVIYGPNGLSSFYDIDINTNNQEHSWLKQTADGMEMAYPSYQNWGAAFITVGASTNDYPRPFKSFTQFSTIRVELRGKTGTESVDIGIKDTYNKDDGSEFKQTISQLSTEWKVYEFPVSSFITADTSHLYTVLEFVFAGATGETVYFRNVSYQP